ncbi:MAG: elongation factor P [Candidatus Microgenomates bacterium]|jgi:elongation factor P
MDTINAGNITKGSFIIFKGAPVFITKAEFMSPGKGTPVMRVKFKNVQTGSAGEFTYKTAETVEVAEIEKKEMNYLYRSGNELVFMDPQSFDQVNIPMSLIEDQFGYLTPNLGCWIVWYKGKAIGATLPTHVTLQVTESPNDVAGNRMNAPKKTVKLETGIEAQVPLFIKVGEKVQLDTTTGEYLGRVK